MKYMKWRFMASKRFELSWWYK